MTKQEILDFFTENYGVAKPKKPRKGKKMGIWRLLWLVTIIGPVLWFLNKKEWKKYDDEVARRAREYPALYEAEINKFLPNEKLFDKALKKSGFDEEDMTMKKAASLIVVVVMMFGAFGTVHAESVQSPGTPRNSSSPA